MNSVSGLAAAWQRGGSGVWRRRHRFRHRRIFVNRGGLGVADAGLGITDDGVIVRRRAFSLVVSAGGVHQRAIPTGDDRSFRPAA